MTNEELIEALTTLKEQARDYGDNTFIWSINIDSFKFVIDSTIKALEQEPTTNNDLGVETTQMIDKSNFSQEQYKADLQSAYDCGYAQAKNDLGVDCISRQALYDALYERFHEEDTNNITNVTLGSVRNFVKDFPSVTPQPRKGYWIKYEKKYMTEKRLTPVTHFIRECSVCHTKFADFYGKMNFCPNCGSRNEVEE